MGIHFDYYKTFYYVAKYKNITTAAGKLYLTQPSVSHAIKCLEDELGITLFIRSKKGVTLTPEAELLYQHVAPACESILNAEQALSSQKALIEGQVRIAACEVTLHSFLIPYLSRFKSLHPQIRLKISNTIGPLALAELKQGEAELAIVPTPISMEPDFHMVELMTFHDIFICGSEYTELLSAPKELSELMSYPLIITGGLSATRASLQNYFQKQGQLLEPNIELATSDLVVPLVKSNIGIGIVAEVFTKEAMSKGEIFQIPLKNPIPARKIYAVWSSEHPLSMAGQEFLNLITT
ncbi:MAG: LysR family transcriptional regulator [Lachnospiraceae bacterium]|nr:LysR family transcriptional regulator [Lachnospiraceae bacterium]